MAGSGLRRLVHPRLGALPERVFADAFLDAITAGSGAARVAVSLWREMGLPRVERRLPLTTAGGKILHVHAAASARPASSTPATPAAPARPGG